MHCLDSNCQWIIKIDVNVMNKKNISSKAVDVIRKTMLCNEYGVVNNVAVRWWRTVQTNVFGRRKHLVQYVVLNNKNALIFRCYFLWRAHST